MQLEVKPVFRCCFVLLSARQLRIANLDSTDGPSVQPLTAGSCQTMEFEVSEPMDSKADHAAAFEQPTTLPTTQGEAAADMTSHDRVPGAPQVRMRKREIAAVLIAQTSIFLALVAPSAFSLAIKIGAIDPDNKDFMLALAIGVGSTIILFTNPLIGVLSDRTRSRFGRRRPWFVIGMVIGILGSVVVGIASSSSLIVFGWAVALVGYTMSTAMILTHLGDRLPEEQRGKVMGLNGALTQIGPILGIVVAGRFSAELGLMFIVPAVLAFLGSIWFALRMKDPQSTAKLAEFRFSSLTRAFYFNPRKHSNFAWVILSKGLVYVSLSFTTIYGVYLLSSRLGLATTEVASVVALQGSLGVLFAIVGAIGSGWLSDKLGTRKPFLVVSALMIGGGAIAVATAGSIPHYIAGSLLGTLAIGIYGAVDQAIGLDTLPASEGENGRYLGVFGLASAVPQAIGPFAASFVLALGAGDYSWVYFVAALFAALGAVAILPISIGRRASMSTVSVTTLS